MCSYKSDYIQSFATIEGNGVLSTRRQWWPLKTRDNMHNLNSQNTIAEVHQGADFL